MVRDFSILISSKKAADILSPFVLDETFSSFIWFYFHIEFSASVAN